MTKKIYAEWFVFLPSHIYRRHLSPPVRKMCLIYLLHIGITIIVEQNVLIAHIEIHVTESIFGIYMEPLEKNLQDLRGLNHYKNAGLG